LSQNKKRGLQNLSCNPKGTAFNNHHNVEYNGSRNKSKLQSRLVQYFLFFHIFYIAVSLLLDIYSSAYHNRNVFPRNNFLTAQVALQLFATLDYGSNNYHVGTVFPDSY